MSRAPTVALMTRPTVETVPAPPKKVRPEIPITAKVTKYPSARAPALGRGLREPRNMMVRRSKGGATEPPMARTMSPGSGSLMSILLAVVRSMGYRTRSFCAGRWPEDRASNSWSEQAASEGPLWQLLEFLRSAFTSSTLL